jgi:hypothetical protein
MIKKVNYEISGCKNIPTFWKKKYIKILLENLNTAGFYCVKFSANCTICWIEVSIEICPWFGSAGV